PDDSLRIALGDLSMQRATRRIDLRPMSITGVRDVARGSRLDPVLLHELTGGNPFFLTELLAADSTKLPGSARDAVLARCAPLAPQARSALDVVALIGGRMEPVLLAKAGIDGVDVDELVAAGLLVADGGAVRFRHELSRLAIDAQLGPHRRMQAHRIVLDALQAFGCDDDARLAFHADGAGDVVLVRRYAPSAAAAAAQLGAHREAVAQYERALRFTDRSDPRVVAELDDGLAIELANLDRFEEAGVACAEALAIWRRVDEPMRVGRDLRRLAAVMWRLCRGAECQRCRDEAVEVLEPLGPSTELGLAYLSQPSEAQDLAAWADGVARARAVAEEIGAIELLSQVLVSEAAVAFYRNEEWEGMARAALRTALDHGSDDLVAFLYTNLYELLVSSYRFASAEVEYAAGAALCDDRQLDVYSYCLRGRRALALTEVGRWDEALVVAG
ncbi:MAG: hypothetical protein ACHQ02_09160, partial [Candidatus Limnocylindrales bacterium]